ncbi:helix-turn-helix domain-containing protein [Spirosoma sp. HMF4905]|uniref:Helix-turn-helix domain-containing protein n=1 Tax=Spirosoma arboris TaxID=2682092 RepID=A0A7K1S6G0_9BACT|nr:helix-turn-helix domain-containing protein [Spirosoma arboris]MVM29300.1 helix-turn-helix domain-containing protein [Spirosoma arboris]
MNNPFQELADRLANIESLLTGLAQSPALTPTKIESDPLNVSQVAQLLGLTNQTIYDKVHDNTLPHVKQGNRIYFFRDELIQWLKSGRQQTSDELQAKASQVVGTTLSTRRRRGGRQQQ